MTHQYPEDWNEPGDPLYDLPRYRRRIFDLIRDHPNAGDCEFCMSSTTPRSKSSARWSPEKGWRRK